MRDIVIGTALIVTGITFIVWGLTSLYTYKQPKTQRVYFPDFNLSSCDIIIIDESRNRITCGDQEADFVSKKWHL